MRLYLFVKNNANLTRSEVTSLQNDGRILVNGKIVSLTTDIIDSDIVTIDNNIIRKKPFVYYLYNKPIGIICTNNKKVAGSILNHIDIEERVYPIGRLDKESRGLLILTNDSNLCHQVLSNHFEKEYIVKVKDKITNDFITAMPLSVLLRGKATLPCKVSQVDDYHFKIILVEGKYHQIRRMVVLHGNKVVDLKRIRIGNIWLNDLEEGKTKRIENIKEQLNIN